MIGRAAGAVLVSLAACAPVPDPTATVGLERVWPDSAPQRQGASRPVSPTVPEPIAIRPRAVPARPAGADPNPVAFALATTHPVGRPVYPRPPSSAAVATGQSCSRFAGPGLAQAAFLNAGGPETDRMGLDPDGDGYVCGWDPAPFRRAVR